MADGLHVTGDLLGIIERAGKAGLSAIDAAVVELGRRAKVQMTDELNARSHPKGTATPASEGGPPARVSGAIADSVRMTTRYSSFGVKVKVGPTDYRARFLDLGWSSGGTRHKFPFTPEVAERSRAEAGEILGEQVRIHFRGEGL